MIRERIQNRPMDMLRGLFSGSKGVEWEPERAYGAGQAQQQMEQVQQALANQRRFAEALQVQSPQAIADQALIAKQLRAQSVGAAPSVAERQLAQATGEGIAAQQALMAGQRGGSANVGLLAREAGMAGGRARQQAIGQGATLRAQEQLLAQQALANLAGTQIGQISGAQGMGMQGELQAQQNVLNAIAQANQARAGVAQQTAAGQAGIVGGIFSGLAGLGGRAAGGGAAGGEVGKDFANYAEGGSIGTEGYWNRLRQDLGTMGSGPTLSMPGLSEGSQRLGAGLRGLMTPSQQEVAGTPGGGYAGANLGVDTSMQAPINPMATSQNIAQFKPGFAEGGNVPAMVSPGERYLPPSEVKKVAQGEKPAHKAGKMIPGKAKVEGDSYENDTVKATLKEGGIVIPRSVMQSGDPAEKARDFVNAILARKQFKRK